jgi:hypothetical protein
VSVDSSIAATGSLSVLQVEVSKRNDLVVPAIAMIAPHVFSAALLFDQQKRQSEQK